MHHRPLKTLQLISSQQPCHAIQKIRVRKFIPRLHTHQIMRCHELQSVLKSRGLKEKPCMMPMAVVEDLLQALWQSMTMPARRSYSGECTLRVLEKDGRSQYATDVSAGRLRARRLAEAPGCPAKQTSFRRLNIPPPDILRVQASRRTRQIGSIQGEILCTLYKSPFH
jgi:hypothetical protein